MKNKLTKSIIGKIVNELLVNQRGIFRHRLPTDVGIDLESRWTMERYSKLRLDETQIMFMGMNPDDKKAILRWRKNPNFLHVEDDVADHLLGSDFEKIAFDFLNVPTSASRDEKVSAVKGSNSISMVPSLVLRRDTALWHMPAFRRANPLIKEEEELDFSAEGSYLLTREEMNSMIEPIAIPICAFEENLLDGRNTMLEFHNDGTGDTLVNHAVSTGYGRTSRPLRIVGAHLWETHETKCEFHTGLRDLFHDQARDSTFMQHLLGDYDGNKDEKLVGRALEMMLSRTPLSKLGGYLMNLIHHRLMEDPEFSYLGSLKHDPEFRKLANKGGVINPTEPLGMFDPILQEIEQDETFRMLLLSAKPVLKRLSDGAMNQESLRNHFPAEELVMGFLMGEMFKAYVQIYYNGHFASHYFQGGDQFGDHVVRRSPHETIKVTHLTVLYEQEFVRHGKKYYYPLRIKLIVPHNNMGLYNLMASHLQYSNVEDSSPWWGAYSLYATLATAQRSKLTITERIKIDHPNKRPKKKGKKQRRIYHYSLKMDLRETAMVEVNREIINPRSKFHGAKAGHERQMGFMGFKWVLEKNASPDEEWYELKENDTGNLVVKVRRRIGNGIKEINGGYPSNPEPQRGKLKSFQPSLPPHGK